MLSNYAKPASNCASKYNMCYIESALFVNEVYNNELNVCIK